jgi:amidase
MLSDEGLPVGLQIIGAQYDDYSLIEMAGMFERGLGGFTPPQGY